MKIEVPWEARWDGKDLATLQLMAVDIPRHNGEPVVRADDQWNITVATSSDGLVPLRVGHWVVTVDGRIWVECRGDHGEHR